MPQAVMSRAGTVDLNRSEERKRLAKMVVSLFDHWQLSTSEQAAALGLSEANRSTISKYRHGNPLAAQRDLLERAGHLLAIHKSLRIIFPQNRDLAYRWMTAPNSILGARPIDIVRERGFEGLAALRRYLDFERGR
jgi:hypothetical protein